MKKKNIIITLIIVIISMALLGTGIYMFINEKPSQKRQLIESKEEQLDNQDMIDKKYNRKRNKSEAMKEKHCLDKICVIDIGNILEYGSIGVISGNIANAGDSPVPAGYLKFTFTVGDTKEKLVFYHEEFPVGKEIPLEIQHSNEKIVEATNLKIEIPTAEEIKEAENKSAA